MGETRDEMTRLQEEWDRILDGEGRSERSLPDSDVLDVSTDMPGFDEVFYNALVPGCAVGPEQVEMQYRMDAVFRAMRHRDVDVLERRYVGLATLDDIAEQLGITRQAVLKRLEAAKANFKVAFAQHWNDPLED